MLYIFIIGGIYRVLTCSDEIVLSPVLSVCVDNILSCCSCRECPNASSNKYSDMKTNYSTLTNVTILYTQVQNTTSINVIIKCIITFKHALTQFTPLLVHYVIVWISP